MPRSGSFIVYDNKLLKAQYWSVDEGVGSQCCSKMAAFTEASLAVCNIRSVTVTPSLAPDA